MRDLYRKLSDSPVLVVFFASLVLSTIARTGTLINRDGMLYVQTARAFLDDGLNAALSVYSWPFFPILFASFSRITGLDLESSGYMLNAFFMAGACALLVDIARKQYPEATWLVVLTVLALPGVNDYRDELLREYGAWFFMMLALWLAIRFSDFPQWKYAVPIFPVLGVGSLFRPEIMVFSVAIFLWMMFVFKRECVLQRLLMIAAPVFLLVGVVIALRGDFIVSLFLQSRLVHDVAALLLPDFDYSVKRIMDVLPNTTEQSAKTILVFGSLAIVPVRFLEKLGLFFIPFVVFFIFRRNRPVFSWSSLFFWSSVLYVFVLSFFVMKSHFLAGRYVATLLWFSTPLIGCGLYCLYKKFQRVNVFILLVLLVFAFSNVVSLSPEKRYFVDAGEWLAKNVQDSTRVYSESGRTSYFAGWLIDPGHKDIPRNDVKRLLEIGDYDLAVMEVSRNESDFDHWLLTSGLGTVRIFTHVNGDRVVIVSKKNNL